MALSLFLMLASETYCECLVYLMLATVTQLLYSQYVILTGSVCNQISYVPVYKLVRFYEPGSEEQYETTRTTLTVFSGYFLSYSFNLVT
jgi:hypothetical protein